MKVPFWLFALMVALVSFNGCNIAKPAQSCLGSGLAGCSAQLYSGNRKGWFSVSGSVQDTIFTQNELASSLERLVSHIIEPFRNATAEELRHRLRTLFERKTYRVTPNGARKAEGCVVWSWQGGNLTFNAPTETETMMHRTKPFWYNRLRWTWELFEAIKMPRDDFEIAQCLHDCVQTVRKEPQFAKMPRYPEPGPIPILSLIQCCGISDDIPAPVFESGRPGPRTIFSTGLRDWDVACALQAASALPWAFRLPKAVFRGSGRESLEETRLATVSGRRGIHGRRGSNAYGRRALAEHGRRHPALLDVLVTESGGNRSAGGFMSVRKLVNYRYSVHAEGNCGWADRLWWQLHAPQVLLKQRSPCGLYFEPLMKPYRDHIPVSGSFDDLSRKVKWLQRHESDALVMATNAMRFAEAYLVRRSILKYFEMVLNQYAQIWRHHSYGDRGHFQSGGGGAECLRPRFDFWFLEEKRDADAG
jgi:hypothetical protein